MMTKTIDTLVEDIEDILEKPHEWNKENAEELGHNIASVILSKLSHPGKKELRMSNLGESCDRKLWYSVNTPELEEPLRHNVRLKFLFGDIIEELMLFLAKEAGHTVFGRQTQLELFGVRGHRDAVIDGVLVDVKSASTFSLKKFKDGLNASTDSFGYLPQLAAYRDASTDTTSSDMAFLAVDKTLGNIVLDRHKKTREIDWERIIAKKRDILAKNSPPNRGFSDEEFGKSGNRKLGTKCSYCGFKQHCWPGLRTFLYSSGPVHLTEVVRLPDVPEITGDLITGDDA